ncbi:UNVERIFIED_CONTAM: hypothetical protein K2H54_058886 [Gekko kuhli]
MPQSFPACQPTRRWLAEAHLCFLSSLSCHRLRKHSASLTNGGIFQATFYIISIAFKKTAPPNYSSHCGVLVSTSQCRLVSHPLGSNSESTHSNTHTYTHTESHELTQQ